MGLSGTQVQEVQPALPPAPETRSQSVMVRGIGHALQPSFLGTSQQVLASASTPQHGPRVQGSWQEPEAVCYLSPPGPCEHWTQKMRP